MSNWRKVGDWLKDNATDGAALVGSLLTGNVAGAVAAGIGMVSSATGSDKPNEVLARLQNDPSTVIRLKEIALEDQKSIRAHIEAIERLKIEDAQHSHETTQNTIRNGDNAEDIVVKRTRPLQTWLALIAAISYMFICSANDSWEFSIEAMLMLMVLPYTYFGLREVGKGILNVVTNKAKGGK